PPAGDGTGAPVGAGTSRVQEVTKVCGRSSTHIYPKQAQNLCFSTRTACLLLPTCGTVPSRAWAGTHVAAATSSVCGHRPCRPGCACSRRRESVTRRDVAAGARPRDRSEVPLGSARALFARRTACASERATRDTERGKRIAARTTCGAAEAARHREAQHAHRPDRDRATHPHALRDRPRRTARSRSRREEPRRGDDEPRQPGPRVRARRTGLVRVEGRTTQRERRCTRA